MNTGHELFIHGLTDILDGERQLVDALQKLENDSTNPQLKKAFATHREETEGQIERLERCFELLEEEIEESECAGIRGIIEEKKAFMEEEPSEDILDVFHIGAGLKTETYEICEYESLVEMAREMKHTEVAKLLRENLKEEQATLKKLESLSDKIKPEQMMAEEEEEMEEEEEEVRASSSNGRSRKRKVA